jgi:hypothetical protein
MSEPSETTPALLFASYDCGNRHYFVEGGRAPATCPRGECDAGIEAVYHDQTGPKPPENDDRRDTGEEAHDPDGANDTSDAVRALAASLAEPGIITERQALALVLSDVEGVRRREAADRMDCSPSNFDSLRHRARSSLRDATTTLSILRELDETPEAALPNR